MGEAEIEDYWTTDAFPDSASTSTTKQPSEPWTGYTRFYVRRPKPPKSDQGFPQAWVYGHNTPVRRQTTQRSPHWHPNDWSMMSDSRRTYLIRNGSTRRNLDEMPNDYELTFLITSTTKLVTLKLQRRSRSFTTTLCKLLSRRSATRTRKSSDRRCPYQQWLRWNLHFQVSQ